MVRGDASRYQVPVPHIETWKSLWIHQVVFRIPGAGLCQEVRFLHRRLRCGWCLPPFFGRLLNKDQFTCRKWCEWAHCILSNPESLQGWTFLLARVFKLFMISRRSGPCYTENHETCAWCSHRFLEQPALKFFFVSMVHRMREALDAKPSISWTGYSTKVYKDVQSVYIVATWEAFLNCVLEPGPPGNLLELATWFSWRKVTETLHRTTGNTMDVLLSVHLLQSYLMPYIASCCVHDTNDTCFAIFLDAFSSRTLARVVTSYAFAASVYLQKSLRLALDRRSCPTKWLVQSSRT